jgi:3-phenylpropionate/cinnamic acid dioxygenase small subunit
MPGTDDALWREIEALYRREVRLLQAGEYRDWLGLLGPEMRYRAPVVRVADHRADAVAKDGELAYYDDDRTTLELRVEKLASTMAWTEYPPSRLRYFVQLLDVSHDSETVIAVSNFLVFQTRHESHENIFYGERTDRLRELDGGLVIVDRQVVLDRSRLPSENLSLFF